MSDADLAMLALQVRQGAAARQVKTFLVEVKEWTGWWELRVPELPRLQLRADRRQDIQPVARESIAAALRVPQHMFELHVRFRD
jgi:hypothetical protein